MSLIILKPETQNDLEHIINIDEILGSDLFDDAAKIYFKGKRGVSMTLSLKQYERLASYLKHQRVDNVARNILGY